VRAHGIDHIHAHWMTTSSTIAYVCHIMTGIAWSCTAHAHDIFSRNLTAAKAGSAQFVRVISVRNHGTLSELTAHRYDERLYVGHLGVEVPDSSAPLRAANDIVTMVCPARLHPMKGHMDLLEALARLRDAGCKFHCDLAGDGPLRAAIEERIAQLGIQKHVTIRGVVPHSVLLAQLRSGTYDLVALSSIEEPALKGFFEGIPVALMEPMAAGVPCVSTTIGSIPELIDEQCGSLVEQHDAQAFADAIARFARNPLLRQRAGIAARRRVQREFNTVETTRELYERICAASERGHGGTPSLNKPRSIPTANAN
jgi:glycosyltransferase involved in cell wall biosynthesis